MKINQIIELSSAFSAEVNVSRDFKYTLKENNRYIDGYLPNKSSRQIISSIFETLSIREDRKLHLITASYGTGKSYLLLILGYLLGNKNIDFFSELEKKITDKDGTYEDGLSRTLKNHWQNNASYLIVIPKYGSNDFEQGMLSALNLALKSNDIEYFPNTHYIRAAEVIEHWKTAGSILYNQFQEKILGKKMEDFILLLRDCDSSAYETFKTIYKIIVGTEFSENHGDVFQAFKETAVYIAKLGYKGIVTVYDEFGAILDKLINKAQIDSTIRIQQFLEQVKEKNDSTANLIFIAASHQDPNTIKEDKQQNIDKLLGRFEKHRLEVADSESEELIGKVFLTLDKAMKDKFLTNRVLEDSLSRAKQLRLYPSKSESWVSDKIVKDLYPLHPLTSFILPRLSNQFAQNNRSMFNFLSPNEPGNGSLKKYMDSMDAFDLKTRALNLFTPDQLLDYFRPNLAASAMDYLVDAFDLVMGKIDDPVIRRVMSNLLILTASRRKEVNPSFEVLHWAMNDQSIHDFKNLLDDLVNEELLELNPLSKTYEFPLVGIKNFSKVHDEEKKKLQDLNLYSCKDKWEEIEPLVDYSFLEYNSTYGSNRSYKILYVTSKDQLEIYLYQISKFYKWESRDGLLQGIIVYLLVQEEDFIHQYKKIMKEQFPEIVPYAIFAKPKESDMFSKLIDSTINYLAYVNAGNNPDIRNNQNHNAKLTVSLGKARSELSNQIKDTFSPVHWDWTFDLMESWSEIKNQRGFANNMDDYVQKLFYLSPVIKDDALWFVKPATSSSYRSKALVLILGADPKRIPLINNGNNSVESRIVTNFLSNTGLAIETKTIGKVHYGEIITPSAESNMGKIWHFIDKTLVVDKIVNLHSIVQPLLAHPYGLSEHIVKFIFASFLRYNDDIIIIADIKRPTQVLNNKSAEDLDEFFKKPFAYGIRKIQMSGFEKKYVKQLQTLFERETASGTFSEVSKKFEGLSPFFTNLSYALIRNNSGVNLIYEKCLNPFLERLREDGVNREAESKEFFMEILPSHILNISSREEFENDQDNISLIIAKLREAKEFPSRREAEFRLEVLGNVADQVFGEKVATAEEFKNVVKDWFIALPPTNKRTARFENQIIMIWLTCLRNDQNIDPTRFYLEDIAPKSIKDWQEPLVDTNGLINKLRGFKQEIEDYTKNPIEEYQFIARACFSLSSLECTSELVFIQAFNNWWNQLPALNKDAYYEHEEVNIFIEEFKSSASIKNRFLVQTPIKWKDGGFLPIFNVEWENWDRNETYAVSALYERCVSIIAKWQPPIAEAELVSRLAKLFMVIGQVDDFQSLTSKLDHEWFKHLPLNTQLARFKEESYEQLLITALKEGTLRQCIMIDFVNFFKLKEFIYWDQDILEEFIVRITEIKTNIENYRRSYIELVHQLNLRTKDKSSSIAEYRGKLKDRLMETAAFKNKAEDQGEEFINPLGASMLVSVRRLYTDQDFVKLISEMAKLVGIEDEYYHWSADVQLNFVKEFNQTIKYLIEWVFPEEQLLNEAKEKITMEIDVLQIGLNITDFQLLKILRDLIDERSGKKS